MAARGTHQRDAPLGQALPQWVRVTGLVVEHTRRLLARPTGAVARAGTSGQGRVHEGSFRRGRRVQEVSPRKTVAVDHHHPRRPRATCGLPDAGPPVFAGAKLPSAKVSAQSSRPWASSWAKKACQPLRHTPWASQSRRRRPQVLGDGHCSGSSGHRAPVRKIPRRPSKPGRCGMGVGPPPGEAWSAGNQGAIFAHCASVSSDCFLAIARDAFRWILQRKASLTANARSQGVMTPLLGKNVSLVKRSYGTKSPLRPLPAHS
jgi:hypothetical protein